MKNLLILLLAFTACGTRSIIPPGDPGKITAHLELAELPTGKGDTLKCVVYSLTNESEHDYYLPYWGLSGGVKFNYSEVDTSLYGTWPIPWIYTLDLEIDNDNVREEAEILRAYLLSRQHSTAFGLKCKSEFEKIDRKLKRKHVKQVFQQNPKLTPTQRERIQQVLTKPDSRPPILLKAGSTLVVGISGDLVAIRDAYKENYFKNYPTQNCNISITYDPFLDKLVQTPGAVWIYGDDLNGVLPSTPIPGKIWYYDPEPYPKYKSYYRYLGDITSSDTIVIQSKYLLK